MTTSPELSDATVTSQDPHAAALIKIYTKSDEKKISLTQRISNFCDLVALVLHVASVILNQ